jgi:hypothetical protein
MLLVATIEVAAICSSLVAINNGYLKVAANKGFHLVANEGFFYSGRTID